VKIRIFNSKNIKINLIKFSLVLICLIMIFSYGTGHAAAANSNIVINLTTFNNEYVNNTSGNDYNTGATPSTPKKTISDAIANLNNNGTVHIASGIYTGSGNNNIQINENMTIIGEKQTNTIINAHGTNQIFITSNVTVTLEDLTLTNGTANSGGAISNYGNLTVENCTFTDSFASYSIGGAIDNDGTLNINNSTFTNNTASIYGGAIYNDDTLIETNDTYNNNTAYGYGGAIYNDGTFNVTGNTYKNNIAADGGAIENYGTIIVTESTFTNNTAYNYGGAIYNNFKAYINFNRIVGNSAPQGNAIFNDGGVVNASLNWWGSNANPSSQVSGGVNVSPWLVLTITANPTTIPNNSSSTITTDLQHDSNGTIHDPANGQVPNKIPVIFQTTLGTISNSSPTIDVSAQSTLNSGLKAGLATISAKVDNQTVKTSVLVIDTIPPTASVNPIGGVFNSTQNVTLSMSEPGTIYYTTNGNTPTFNSNRYTAPIPITTKTTLEFFAMDLTGNISPVYTDKYTITPKVTSSNPANGTVNIPPNQVINVTFTEPIKIVHSSGITLKSSNGTAVSFTTSINGNVLTITPTKLLTNDTKYNLTLNASSITDLAGNPLALWSSSFTVDPTPKVTNINPTNGTTNIPTNKVITVTFSEPIKAGNMSIQLKNSNGTTVSFTTNIKGNTLTLTPTALLSNGTKYTLILHTGCVTDLVGNTLALTSTNFTTTKT
jgi:methionine-rich copper-binding protein CopC